MRRVVLVGLLLAVAVTGGCRNAQVHNTSPTPPAHFTITGRVISQSGGVSASSNGCATAQQQFGAAPGADVRVSDASGTEIATGHLSKGIADQLGGCVLHFTVPNVPGSLPRYFIAVGNQAAQMYPRAQLDGPITIDLF